MIERKDSRVSVFQSLTLCAEAVAVWSGKRPDGPRWLIVDEPLCFISSVFAGTTSVITQNTTKRRSSPLLRPQTPPMMERPERCRTNNEPRSTSNIISII